MFVRLIKGLVDLVYPRRCLACKNRLTVSAFDDFVCPECWCKIKRNLPPFCHSCGRRLQHADFAKNICVLCLKKKLHFDRAFSPCIYDGVLKELIHEFKYKGKDYLGLPLSKLMIEFIQEYDLPIDYLDFIIPIPLHKTRLREREFNQAEILSNYIAKEFKKEVLSDILIRNRHTKRQTDLETGDRFFNVKGSFSVTKDNLIQGKNLMVVDDVLTTGATSSEAAYALKEVGAGIVFVLTLAN